VGEKCKSTFLNQLAGKGKRKREKTDRCNSTVPKLACVEKWKDTVQKWALMKNCIIPDLKIYGGRKV
jgi:hypothetical protein